MLRARWAMDDLLEEARGGAGAPAGHEVEVA